MSSPNLDHCEGTVREKSMETVVQPGQKLNCRACTYSFMEPDSDLICDHPDAGLFGLTIRSEPLPHCGWKKFAQHPNRDRDGTLKQVAAP